MCYTRRLLINKFNARRTGHELEHRFSKLVEITQSKSHYALRRSRSFKVTDFSTNRNLIYDFLLVINTNLPHLAPFLSYGQISLARGECLTFTLSLRVIPANIAVSDILLKTGFFGLHFCCRKCQCIFNHFYVIRPESK